MMFTRILNRTVVTEKKLAHFCQIVCSLTAALVMLLGIRTLAEIDLTQVQLYTALTGMLVLSGVFIVLGCQCRAWRFATRDEA